MGMPQATHFWTPDEVRALPEDGHRYEVVAGELLVTPAPSLPHQEAVARLLYLFWEYLDRMPVGYVAISPADIEPEAGALVQPDVFVAPLVAGRRPRSWKEIRSLLLAVEILSSSSARADRTVKRRLYQRAGVTEYWVVDLDARLVERWRPTDDRPELVTETLDWQPEPGYVVTPHAVPAFTLDLPRFFASVLDDA